MLKSELFIFLIFYFYIKYYEINKNQHVILAFQKS